MVLHSLETFAIGFFVVHLLLQSIVRLLQIEERLHLVVKGLFGGRNAARALDFANLERNYRLAFLLQLLQLALVRKKLLQHLHILGILIARGLLRLLSLVRLFDPLCGVFDGVKQLQVLVDELVHHLVAALVILLEPHQVLLHSVVGILSLT